MSAPPQTATLEQFAASLQNDIILAQSRAQQVSINNFNQVFQQLQQALMLNNKKDEEIKKFNNFCKAKKIDYPPIAKSPPKENKIAPVAK